VVIGGIHDPDYAEAKMRIELLNESLRSAAWRSGAILESDWPDPLFTGRMAERDQAGFRNTARSKALSGVGPDTRAKARLAGRSA